MLNNLKQKWKKQKCVQFYLLKQQKIIHSNRCTKNKVCCCNSMLYQFIELVENTRIYIRLSLIPAKFAYISIYIYIIIIVHQDIRMVYVLTRSKYIKVHSHKVVGLVSGKGSYSKQHSSKSNVNVVGWKSCDKN